MNSFLSVVRLLTLPHGVEPTSIFRTEVVECLAVREFLRQNEHVFQSGDWWLWRSVSAQCSTVQCLFGILGVSRSKIVWMYPTINLVQNT